jgi:hypothetical protein
MARVLNRGLLLFLGGDMDKRILIGFGVAVVAGALWVGYALMNPVITLKKCNKVTTEMKRDDVVRLMGMPGKQFNVGLDDTITEVQFMNPDKSFCKVRFIGGRAYKADSEGLE